MGQLNGNEQKGMLQIDEPPVENFWLRHRQLPQWRSNAVGRVGKVQPAPEFPDLNLKKNNIPVTVQIYR